MHKLDILIAANGCYYHHYYSVNNTSHTYHSVYFAIEKENEKLQNDYFIAKPDLKIKFREIDERRINIEIKSIKANSNKIDDLYFKFDIPGRFAKLSNEKKMTFGESNIHSSMLAGNAWVDIAQTVYVECKSISRMATQNAPPMATSKCPT